ncbi:hypothetical protein [Dechloromonas hortensis]|uniref:hypothetical protein n=1 Tax=Dechloromonas hortensis TaxID=337779 RepID=UPI001292285E|nr:hypothetical protein [Dechloromonas hortensis]
MFTRCIWPGHCGEGFAAGYAAGAVGVMGALWAVFWLISEGLMQLGQKTDQNDDN